MSTVIVLHSTEGGTLTGAVATLRASGNLSHEVWDVQTREMVNLVPLYEPAKALLNLPGGVETNNRAGHVVQIELVGYASRSSAAGKGPGPIIPELDADDLRWLGQQLRLLCTAVHAPFTFPCPFEPYPASAGADNGVRLSFDEWLAVEGVIGHQHVPENDHGDPGALDVARMASLSAPPQETDMASLVQPDDGDIAVFVTDGVIKSWVQDGAAVASLRDAGIARGALDGTPIHLTRSAINSLAPVGPPPHYPDGYSGARTTW